VGHDDAHVVVLTCADHPRTSAPPVARGLRTVAVPARPGRGDLDPVLADPDLRRLVVAGTDADLAAVLQRLLRAGRLDVELAYLPADRRSPAARVWGLPAGSAAVDLARDGAARPVPLVRDDAGGVLVGRAELRGAGGGAVHGEAYCDAALTLRGPARRLVVTPWPHPTASGTATTATTAGTAATGGTAVGGVAVRAGLRGTLPDGRVRAVPPTARAGRGAATGRAVQVGCLPATLVHDGVAHPRPVTRWAWYRHVADWLLVRDPR
jgi:hypothetical protein